MATLEPDNDPIKHLLESLGEPDLGTIETPSLLDDAELASRFNRATQDLLERGEALSASTETGRDLHSQRSAYLYEMRKRGLR